MSRPFIFERWTSFSFTYFKLRVVVESHQKPLRLPDCDIMSAFDMAERESIQLRPLPDLLSLVNVWLPKSALGTEHKKSPPRARSHRSSCLADNGR